MTLVHVNGRPVWDARFEFNLDGRQHTTMFTRIASISDDRFLQYLDQRHAELCAMGAAPIIRKTA